MSRLPIPCLKCGTPTKAGSYCPEHQPVRRRATPYNYAWRKASLEARRRQPWCSVCGATEDLTGDHLVSLAAGGELVPDASLIDVKCRKHNSARGAGTKR